MSAATPASTGRELLPPWLHAAYNSVLDMEANNRLPHALVVQSPLGWCERQLASVLACQILQLEPQLLMESVANADLRWLSREEGAQSYKVEQIRDAISFMQRTAQGNGRKVIVVPMAHRMNEASANSLLKTLEEPPEGGHWLLLCNEPGQLLPTIRSRCQSIVVAPDRAADNSDYITQLIAEVAPDMVADIRPAELAMLRFEYMGAPEQVASAMLAGEEPIWPLLAGVLDDRDLITAVAERWAARELAELTSAWQRYAHALVAEQLPGYASRPAAVDREKLFRFVDELRDARGLVTFHAGLNRRLLLERLLLRWCTLFG